MHMQTAELPGCGSMRYREAVLAFLLGRVGAFADEAASTLYVNQLRASGAAFENLQTRRYVLMVILYTLITADC